MGYALICLAMVIIHSFTQKKKSNFVVLFAGFLCVCMFFFVKENLRMTWLYIVFGI